MRRPRPSFRPELLILSLLGTATLLPPAALADVGPPSEFRRSLELAIGPLHEGSFLEGERTMLALRAAWRSSGPWAVELSVAEHREDTLAEIEATTLELSLRRSLLRNEVVDFFVYGGAGYSDGAFDVEYQPVPFDILYVEHVEEDSWTGHLGLGVEISLGERWFVRTDLRERYLGEIERLERVLDREATFSWGWRF